MFTSKTLALAAALALSAPAAHADLVRYQAWMFPETPAATGSGVVNFVFDTNTLKLLIDASWTGLSGITTVAHIHCCTAAPGTNPLVPPTLGASPTVGVAVTPGTLPDFPVGVSSGTYSREIDLGLDTSFTNPFRNANGGAAGARAAVLAGMMNGRAYFNVHTDKFPGGEIRGFIHIPEPASLALAALGLLAVAGLRRRA